MYLDSYFIWANITGASASLFLCIWYLYYQYSVAEKKAILQGDIPETNTNTNTIEEKKEIPYENKYREKWISFPNDIFFSEEDYLAEKEKEKSLLEDFEREKQLKMKEFEEKKNENGINRTGEEEFYWSGEEFETDKQETSTTETLEEINQLQPNLEDIQKESFLYKENLFLDRLKHNFIIEHTPLGNVAMCYNHKKGSFEYYSDNTIPYRYLETVSRKYVITFHCKKIYVNMEEEIKLAENKKSTPKNPSAKEVLAQFKSYKQDFSRGPSKPKSNPPLYQNQRQNQNTKNATFIVKENANRYTHYGKFSNYILLQVVDRKVVDKRYSLSYAEFTKMKHL